MDQDFSFEVFGGHLMAVTRSSGKGPSWEIS
jgi:hypothetical protein